MACIVCGRTVFNSKIWACSLHQVQLGFCKQHLQQHSRSVKCPHGGAHKDKVFHTYNPANFQDRKAHKEYAWYRPPYLQEIRDARAVLKQSIRLQSQPAAAKAMQSLTEILKHDFIVTHETTWSGLEFILARGGIDCQAAVIKHAPDSQESHRDSVVGGGHFVYTRIVTANGPKQALNHGSAGSNSPIMLVFGSALVQTRWREMSGSSTDRYGAIGNPSKDRNGDVIKEGQNDLTLPGEERGALALDVVSTELTRDDGPAENNEFGFFKRIDFQHLRAIIVKLDSGAASTVGVAALPIKERKSMQQAINTNMSKQKDRIAPKQPRNGSNVYGVAGAPVAPGLTSGAAFQTAFGRNLDSLIVGLRKTTLRSKLPGLLTALRL